MRGPYDDGYIACPCFWGDEPASLLTHLASKYDFRNKSVLDAGCGEGKNAAFMAERGANVDAIDVSQIAIKRCTENWGSHSAVTWSTTGVIEWLKTPRYYDLVLAYGLLHCLSDKAEVARTVNKLRAATNTGGYHLICAFNSRRQELFAHPGFQPTLMDHVELTDLYHATEVELCTDTDLREIHPNNRIEHVHSLTRIIARLGGSDG
jgi:cyclopropane fatty-acyl-phospholipid synthase-like methyltransferase